jgi:hypothetical protein
VLADPSAKTLERECGKHLARPLLVSTKEPV